MKGKIRNIYPGGNTPNGFYSYYNYILPQRKAEKIFCIQGGPGVGKSTLMRKIGEHFLRLGENVDFLWCSSDPESLDGILLRERRVAVVDGTSPHVVDPKNPGAVDKIVNLGEYWHEDAMRKNREEIISCNERIGEIFGYAYGYLRCARQQYEFMWEIIKKAITYEETREYRNQLQLKLDGISAVRRAENKARKDSVLGKGSYSGERRKFFAGAITPGGIKNDIPSLIAGLEKVIVVEAPIGYRMEELLAPLSDRLIDAGFDVEEYYCPMFPEDKLEHIVCDDAGVAVVCSNEYHTVDAGDIAGKVIKLRIDIDGSESGMAGDILEILRKDAHENLSKAVELLEKAKAQHDILEGYYVPNMDFEGMEDIKEGIIADIEAK